MKRFFSTLFFILLLVNLGWSQGVKISATSGTPDPTAILDVESDTRGVLIPRMTEADRLGISSPANGLMVYQTDKDAGFYIYYENPQNSANSGWSKLPLGEDGFYINFPSSANSDIILGDAGYGIRSNAGQLEYKNEGDPNWTAFPAPPPWGSLTVWWYKPAGQDYIRPDNNSNIRVYDDGQQYGFYFNGGGNQYAIYSRTAENSFTTTAAVAGFSDVAGQQTYGYLGYNGEITFGDPEQHVYGAAVWGQTDDTNRVAGMFKTTGDADYAAVVSYSNTWIPIYGYVDDYSADYNPPGIYGQHNIWTSSSSFAYENAILGVSIYKLTSGNSAYTTGVYGYAYGYQDAIGVRAYGYSDNTGYGVYAYGSSNAYAKGGQRVGGIGGVLYGDLIGSFSSGEYGLNALGERYGLYVNNLQVNEAPIVEMLQTKDKKIATYVTTSTTNDIILKGTGVLNGKTAEITFDKEISQVIDSKAPIIITVTPIGSPANLYVESYSSKGFVVKTSSDLNKDIKFNWIAILQKQNVEIPQEVYDIDYSNKMERVAKGELYMYQQDDGKIIFVESGKNLLKSNLEDVLQDSKRK